MTKKTEKTRKFLARRENINSTIC